MYEGEEESFSSKIDFSTIFPPKSKLEHIRNFEGSHSHSLEMIPKRMSRMA